MTDDDNNRLFDIDKLLEMWKEDSEIRKDDLVDASKQSSLLHPKYIELSVRCNLHLKRLESKYNVLLRDKWLHYNKKLSHDEIKKYGWDHDPLNGLSVLKTDMDKFFNADADLLKARLDIDYYKEVSKTLKEILDNVKWRHSNIKNMIDAINTGL